MSQPNRVVSGILLLAAIALVGCGKKNTPSGISPPQRTAFKLGTIRLASQGQGPVEKPEIVIVSPAEKAKFKPRDTVDYEVVVRVKDAGDVPTLMRAAFFSGTTTHGQDYLEPRGRSEDGAYHFGATIKAPRTRGVYALRAEAQYTIVPVGGAPPETLRFPSSDIQIEVQ